MILKPRPTAPQNQINRTLATLARFPRRLQLRLFDLVFGRVSSFYRHVGVRAVEIGPHRVTLALANRRRTRNHLRGIHAIAIALPAEYASGLVVAQHLSPDAVVVVKQIQFDLHKAVHGAIRATAVLSPRQGEALRERLKGEIGVSVQVVDESGQSPITGVMQMAWFPRDRAARLALDQKEET